MSKKVNIIGLVYETGSGKLVDYGLGVLCNPVSDTSSHLLDSVDLEDTTSYPPLYVTEANFKPGMDYHAKIVSVSPVKSLIHIIVERMRGVVYSKHLSHYWGDSSTLSDYYKVNDEIIVNFLETKEVGVDKKRIYSFVEKGVNIVPFSSFRYKIGDVVDIHIGSVHGGMLEVWFNGNSNQIYPTFDVLFYSRVQSRVYYPGYPVKGVITNIAESKTGESFYEFSVKHERVDYGLQDGIYPCYIHEHYEFLFATIQAEVEGTIKNYCFEIPTSEIPYGFPHFDKTKIPTYVRICGFNESGEPHIQFDSLMKELFAQHEGETLNIDFIKPKDRNSKFRIWVWDKTLCGLISKASLKRAGDHSGNLKGQIVNGELHIVKGGGAVDPIRVGETHEATILERYESYSVVSIREQSGFLFGCESEIGKSLNVRIVHMDNADNLFLCTPVQSELLQTSGLMPGGRISLRLFEVLGNRIILGDGLHLGIMALKDWDWVEGSTVANQDKSLYVELSIKAINESGLLVLERRPLIDNPWDKATLTVGQQVEARIERITGKIVSVSFDGIFTDVLWKDFCPYDSSYGLALFEVGQIVRMQIRSVSKEIRFVSLSYLPEDGVPAGLSFDVDTEYLAEVITETDKGILVRVNGVYGIVPIIYMLARSLYEENQIIKVHFIKRVFSESVNYFEFSHIATVDISQVIKLGDVIPNAKLEWEFDNWLCFSSDGIPLSCNKIYAKYFSEDRDRDFVIGMKIGQTYSLRVVDVATRRVVPSGMPDYSSLPLGKEFEGFIDFILEEAYTIRIDDLNDIFYVPFVGFCDWTDFHFETRKIGDPVKVKVVSYSKTRNMPSFSLIAGKEDPWLKLSAGDIVTVANLGFIQQENTLCVDVKGIPVLLSEAAICALLGKPWIEDPSQDPGLKSLEEIPEFEMKILQINKEKHDISLMPYCGPRPAVVNKAKVIHQQEDGVWVLIGEKMVGYLPNEEMPDGYQVKGILEKAVCKSFSREKGYALLSVKDLFEKPESSDSTEPDVQLKGILVTKDTELEVNQIVRGIYKYVRLSQQLLFVQVGPFLGSIHFNELSYLLCDVPQSVFETKKEYDFKILEIRVNKKGTLLRLTRKPFLPPPPATVQVGGIVHAVVKRYDRDSGIIVAGLEEYGGLEAVIGPNDLAGCNGIHYPKIGLRFKAVISGVEQNRYGQIRRIRLNHGE